ncbi:MAG: 3'-5' exonuclease, partial [Saprospiraceae bacterium]|nr:3'-5' exonuclease [Saprospiraceae bacterium]MCC6410441.1 3'-5' exonuclease [Saprospiraceae bacterium]
MHYIIYDLEATCWENTPPGYIQETIEIGAFRINPYGEVRGKF